ncbi:MAG TPA: hypothetical protein VFP33_04345 [Gallionella sp.]|nr:hypothetical protein [Gallionella sp.]
MKEWTDDDWQRRFDILYKCQLSSLYHRKRERFYSLLDKVANALALIAGTSAMSELLPSASAKAMAGAVVAAVTLPGIVFTWADKARMHALLASKFVTLESEVIGAGVLDAAQLDKFSECALKLEVEEPPQLSALTRLCQNEIAYAMGETSSMRQLSFKERVLAHFIDMPKASTN